MWQPSLIIQDGYYSWDPIWPLMLPTTFLKNWSFPNFPSFPMLAIPPLLHVNYRVREPHVSHTGINVCAHCPLHLPKKVTEKPSVNHIGSSTSHQWQHSDIKMTFALDSDDIETSQNQGRPFSAEDQSTTRNNVIITWPLYYLDLDLDY